MSLSRRGFLKSIIAAAAAPAIVRADSLMRVFPNTLRWGGALPIVYGLMRASGRVLGCNLVECVDAIDITAVLSTDKQYIGGSYSYSAHDVLVEVPDGRIMRVWADGEEFYDPFELTQEYDARVARLPRLELARFGNRVPEFTFEVEREIQETA